MGACNSTKLRQGAVHPEVHQLNNNDPNDTEPALTLRRPPPHNGQHITTTTTTTKKTTNKRRQRESTPLRPTRVQRIDYTPIAKAERDQYKFACPLCFCYFTDTILTTSCCSNYTCYQCALDHAKSHDLPKKSKHLPNKLINVPCPHCNTANVQLKYVSSDDQVRSYDTSPATKMRLEGEGERERKTERETDEEAEEEEVTSCSPRVNNVEKLEMKPEMDSSSDEGSSPAKFIDEEESRKSSAAVVA